MCGEIAITNSGFCSWFEKFRVCIWHFTLAWLFAVFKYKKEINLQIFLKFHLSFCVDSDSEELPTRRSSRRDEVRDDLPLHNAALHELLADVMKHEDAWPFIRPVQKTEVV